MNNNVDKTLDVVFQGLGVFVHNNPKAEAQRSYAHDLSHVLLFYAKMNYSQ